MFNRKVQPAPKSESTDDQLARDLRETAQRCAELGGELNRRGWSVSVDIYPYTSDKGPVGDVTIYRKTTL